MTLVRLMKVFSKENNNKNDKNAKNANDSRQKFCVECRKKEFNYVLRVTKHLKTFCFVVKKYKTTQQEKPRKFQNPTNFTLVCN